MFGNSGINHAANLPAMDNQSLQVLFGTRLAQFVIAQYRFTLPLNLILEIDSDVDLCRTITYLCEDHSDLPNMSDSALDSGKKRKVISPPKVITFQGFCKGGFETKLSVEQLECIQQSPILNQWYNNQLATSIENGREAIMARFYRHLLTTAHPKNTGLNAGLIQGGNVVGLPTNPVKFDPENADLFMTAVVDTIKQMPRAVAPQNEFGQSTENGYIFGPRTMESVLMQVEKYLRYDSVGSCGACSLFTDVFQHMPRGLMPITSNCIESRTCNTSAGPITIYPVLFGKRFLGAKAALRVKTKNYMSPDGESIFYCVTYYHHIHTYDARYHGVGWITVANNQPDTVEGCS